MNDDLDKVLDDFNQAMYHKNMDQLLVLKNKLLNGDSKDKNIYAKIYQIDKSIAELETKLKDYNEIDIEVDCELRARDFLHSMGDGFAGEGIIKSNDILDKLEKDLGLKED